MVSLQYDHNNKKSSVVENRTKKIYPHDNIHEINTRKGGIQTKCG